MPIEALKSCLILMQVQQDGCNIVSRNVASFYLAGAIGKRLKGRGEALFPVVEPEPVEA